MVTTSFMPAALTVGYLAAFAPHSTSGTLMGPSVEGPMRATVRSRLIVDGPPAQNLAASAQRALEDCQRFRSFFSASRHFLPQPLPEPVQGWILSACHGPRDNLRTGSFSLAQAEGPSRLDVEFDDEKSARFRVTIASRGAELVQQIGINRDEGTVTTERYQIRRRFKDRQTSLSFAGDVSTFLYESGQYDRETELGPLKLREESTGRESIVERVEGRYSVSHLVPSLKGEIMLGSAASVFEIFDASFREPVLLVEVDGEGPFAVTIALNRPPARVARLMPLHERIRNALWDTLLQKIIG